MLIFTPFSENRQQHRPSREHPFVDLASSRRGRLRLRSSKELIRLTVALVHKKESKIEKKTGITRRVDIRANGWQSRRLSSPGGEASWLLHLFLIISTFEWYFFMYLYMIIAFIVYDFKIDVCVMLKFRFCIETAFEWRLNFLLRTCERDRAKIDQKPPTRGQCCVRLALSNTPVVARSYSNINR